MRPISEIRRARLRELVEEQGGVQAAVASVLGKDKNQIYQWLLDPGKPGARNIGHDSAREIETKFSKPRGWMDVDPLQTGGAGSHFESPSARLDHRMIEPATAWAKAMVAAALGGNADFDPHGDIPLFVAAYDLVAAPSQDARARFEEAVALRIAHARGRNAKQGDADQAGGRDRE